MKNVGTMIYLLIISMWLIVSFAAGILVAINGYGLEIKSWPWLWFGTVFQFIWGMCLGTVFNTKN